jgi:hypothetical protein
MSQSPPPFKTEDGNVYRQNVDRDRGVSTAQAPRGLAAWFGGRNTTVGHRIAPVLAGTPIDSDTDDSSSAILSKQIALEENASIKYRTCSWQKVVLPGALFASEDLG